MYIKTLIISGFKSYRDAVEISPPFSQHHNVVVGRNGSGKSNFFAAIRFVLSDAYTGMSRDDRQHLLHEGSSSATTLSAYVEIVFDNSDGRFPTSGAEVHLRRTIGLKKDEYSLDHKSVTKAEVMNLLESAGFSRSNPYYIVPQGRITHLTNISDKERLNLLKEVAGTKVYEDKRAESNRIMEETDAKREKIDELLETIEARLNELEAEKQELKSFQKLDRDRRCLEYALAYKDQEDATNQLERAEEDKNNEFHMMNERNKDFYDLEARIQTLESELTEHKHTLSNESTSLQQFEAEMNSLVRAKAEVECVIDDYKQSSEGSEASHRAATKELARIEERVAAASKRLDELTADMEARAEAERDAKKQLESTQSKLRVLYDKQGRARHFDSKAARDAYLMEEIKSIDANEKEQKTSVTSLDKDVGEAKARLDELTAKSAKEQEDENDSRARLEQMSNDLSTLRTDFDEMTKQKKELWHKNGKVSQNVINAKTEFDKVERKLRGMMDRDTSLGLAAVNDIAKRKKLNGVYGPLYDLFHVEDRHKIAVETVAGASLFHVVVDTNETAEKLIETMVQEKRGRVTFMPLNRLKSVNVQYPQASDAVPMMSKIKETDPKFKPALEQVFGRTVICTDLAVAAQYARSHTLNAITEDGDRADRKGAISGGYHDMSRSRLDTIKQLKRWRDLYEESQREHEQDKAQLSALEHEITQKMSAIHLLEAKRKATIENLNQSRRSNWTQREIELTRQSVERLERSLEDAQAARDGAEAQKNALRDELKTPFAQQLSPQELQLLDTLSKQAEAEKRTLAEASQARLKVSSERSLLNSELTENLYRRKEELRRKVDELDAAAGSGVLQAGEVAHREAKLGSIVKSIQSLSASITAADKAVGKQTEVIAKKNAELDELQQDQQKKTREIIMAQRNADRFVSTTQKLKMRQQEAQNTIRDLGVLPEEAFSKYTGRNSNDLAAKLAKVNDGLKKFAHINKKAFEQYTNFTKQREDLMKRKDELEKSAESIKDLITTLDQRKDEAIQRTFKQVSKNFEEIFGQLVESGRGRLIIQRTASYRDEETENQPTGDGGKVDTYTGVGIQVSFNSKHDEGQKIQQLSGGQKSLVALATVFAIQKCDPAPFYLMDEVDSALDQAYRQSTSKVIHELSRNAQFITTTFRPEMLERADAFYGVYFDKQKVSTISQISREDAQKFVETAAEGPATK